jgi:hypothetical protein
VRPAIRPATTVTAMKVVDIEIGAPEIGRGSSGQPWDGGREQSVTGRVRG